LVAGNIYSTFKKGLNLLITQEHWLSFLSDFTQIQPEKLLHLCILMNRFIDRS